MKLSTPNNKPAPTVMTKHVTKGWLDFTAQNEREKPGVGAAGKKES